MTRHNLQENLSWLLQTSLIVEPPVYAAVGLCSQIESQHTTAAPDEFKDAALISVEAYEARDAAIPQQDQEFVRPALPDKVHRGSPQKDMAKLQSGSRSNKKQLISELSRAERYAHTSPSRASRENFDLTLSRSKKGTHINRFRSLSNQRSFALQKETWPKRTVRLQ